MTDEKMPTGEPEPAPSADPPPLAPIVEQAAAPMPPPATEPVATPAAPPVAPPVAWGAAPAVVAAKGGRTTLAAVAGAGLIVLGVIGSLFGLLIAVLGASIISQFDLTEYGDFGGINDPAALISGAVAFVGILLVVFSLVYLIGGIGVVRSRGWGRVLGLIVGILGSLFWLASVTGSGSAGPDAASGGVFALVLLGIHLYITLALAFVWRRKAA